MSNTAALHENVPFESPLAEVYGQYPFELERGVDVYVFDTEGRRYIDFYGGHAVCGVGHSRKEIVDAVAEQGRKFMFYSNLARIPIREEVAGKLVRFADNNLQKVFFCNSGAEANENALKIAIKISGRSKIASYKGSFHGRTMLAIGATDRPDWHEYLHGWMGETVQLTPNVESQLELLDASVAAVILEPIQSIGGVVVFADEYLQALRERCDRFKIALIFDEVQTGMGRTGAPFVSGNPVNPDMMTLAKSLGGGFPMGAVVMTKEVAQNLAVGDIAATFGGSPLAMAALSATLDCLVKDELLNNAQDVAAYAREIFSEPPFRGVRGKGCLLGIEINRPAKAVQQELFRQASATGQGIITGTCSDPNVVHLLPPLTIQRTHLDELKQALLRILQPR